VVEAPRHPATVSTRGLVEVGVAAGRLVKRAQDRDAAASVERLLAVLLVGHREQLDQRQPRLDLRDVDDEAGDARPLLQGDALRRRGLQLRRRDDTAPERLDQAGIRVVSNRVHLPFLRWLRGARRGASAPPGRLPQGFASVATT
jgi:hypothetical protein